MYLLNVDSLMMFRVFIFRYVEIRDLKFRKFILGGRMMLFWLFYANYCHIFINADVGSSVLDTFENHLFELGLDF